MDITSTLTLNNGVKIPRLGFGTYRLWGQQTVRRTLKYALEAGYRHIDTARAYGNEKHIGKVIKESGIDREEIFITTKLWNTNHGYDKALKAIDLSLKSLNLDYVDLYLIHWPVAGYRESWKALEKIWEDGKAQAIGVSNFMIHHLEKLISEANIIPAVDQVEFTPYLYLKDLYNYCMNNNIIIEAYSPLTRGSKLNDPKLREIAEKYNKTTAQLLIRWGLQQDLISIPKSKHKKWIVENTQVFDFDISDEDMNKLKGFHENLRMSGSRVHEELNKKYLQNERD
ncbi:MAG: aldo/keto reductase [Candidatus Hodarchaeota archaeon]